MCWPMSITERGSRRRLETMHFGFAQHLGTKFLANRGPIGGLAQAGQGMFVRVNVAMSGKPNEHPLAFPDGQRWKVVRARFADARRTDLNVRGEEGGGDDALEELDERRPDAGSEIIDVGDHEALGN